MARFDYLKAQSTALRLIDKFGQSTSIVRVSSDYDPATGEQSVETLETTPATIVSLPASGGLGLAGDNQFAEDLKAGKIRFFYLAAAGLTFTPLPGDILLFESYMWDIAGTTPLNPAGTPVIFTLGCRSSGKVIPESLGQRIDCLEIVQDEW